MNLISFLSKFLEDAPLKNLSPHKAGRHDTKYWYVSEIPDKARKENNWDGSVDEVIITVPDGTNHLDITNLKKFENIILGLAGDDVVADYNNDLKQIAGFLYDKGIIARVIIDKENNVLIEPSKAKTSKAIKALSKKLEDPKLENYKIK